MSESERPLDELVRYQVDNGVARITIDRPEAGNALTAAMRDRLAELFEVVSTTLAVRTVLLTGTGKAFCTGADLRGAQAPASPLPGNEPPPGAPERSAGDGARMIRRGWQRLVTAVLDAEKPVVCALNGTAAGGGAHLAVAEFERPCQGKIFCPQECDANVSTVRPLWMVRDSLHQNCLRLGTQDGLNHQDFCQVRVFQRDLHDPGVAIEQHGSCNPSGAATR